MKKVLYACMLVSLTSVALPSLAQVEDASTPEKPTVVITETNVDKLPAAIVAIVDEDNISEKNLLGSEATNFKCELGNKITTYMNPSVKKHIAIRWKNQLRRLHRVMTTTGANRFENEKHGLVWIDIPTKGMLLDSNKGQQLANECRDAAQEKIFTAKK